MFEFADYLVRNDIAFFGAIGKSWTTFFLMFNVGFILLMGFFMPVGGILTYVERKIAAFTQSRIGPNRVGPWGLGQFLADGVKLILKEDITPAAADRPLFKMAPYAVVAGAFVVLVVVPLGPNLIVADMDLGLLVYLAASSFVTMGIVMSGWASNNKWSTMGAARSVAQIVSYEIPVGLALVPLVLLAGSLSFQDMVMMQGAFPWQWNMFHSPGLFLCAFCYFIAAMAEINRTPFDIPEAESELVSGYNTEYSGMRFGMFFMAEFANVLIISIITVVVFMGGWHFPGEGAFISSAFGEAAAARFGAGLPAIGFVQSIEQGVFPMFALYQALGHGALLTKAAGGVVLIILARWTLPRVRVDQLMNICWKYLVPVTMFSIFITAVFMITPGIERVTWSRGGEAFGHWFFWIGMALIGAAFLRAFLEERHIWKPAVGTARNRNNPVEVADGR